MLKSWLITEEKKKESIIKIDIFDFDDTLIYVPSPEKAKQIVLRYNIHASMNGKPEIKPPQGYYWYSTESLEPPIIPDPCPCSLLNHKLSHEFYASAKNPRRLTVVMTGRPPYLEKQVKRVLDDFKMKPDRLYLMPDNGKTLANKIAKIAELLDEFPHVPEVEMWDDKGPIKSKLIGRPLENHVAEFKKFLSICNEKRIRRDATWQLKFKVNEVPPRDNEAANELAKQHPDYGKSPDGEVPLG